MTTLNYAYSPVQIKAKISLKERLFAFISRHPLLSMLSGFFLSPLLLVFVLCAAVYGVITPIMFFSNMI